MKRILFRLLLLGGLFANNAIAETPASVQAQINAIPWNGLHTVTGATLEGLFTSIVSLFPDSVTPATFTPSTTSFRMTSFTVGLSDSSGVLPTGPVVVVSNVGANPMYCNVNGAGATTDDELIPSNSWFAFSIPAGVTTLHCIATGSSTQANGLGGSGFPTGSGGGTGGGGGGGGSVTQGTVPWVMDTQTGVGSNLWSAVTAAIPAGTNTIGGVLQATNPWIIDAGISGNLYGALIGAIPAGSNLIGSIQGPNASGNTVTGNPMENGGRAQSAEATPVANAQAVVQAFDLVGKAVTSPYANKENWVRGENISTASTGAITLIAAQGAGLKIYITSLHCGRIDAGTAASIVTLNDSVASIFVLTNSGGGGITNVDFPSPLVVAANTALTFTSGTSLTSVYCNAQGFFGS